MWPFAYCKWVFWLKCTAGTNWSSLLRRISWTKMIAEACLVQHVTNNKPHCWHCISRSTPLFQQTIHGLAPPTASAVPIVTPITVQHSQTRSLVFWHDFLVNSVHSPSLCIDFHALCTEDCLVVITEHKFWVDGAVPSLFSLGNMLILVPPISSIWMEPRGTLLQSLMVRWCSLLAPDFAYPRGMTQKHYGYNKSRQVNWKLTRQHQSCTMVHGDIFPSFFSFLFFFDTAFSVQDFCI